MENNKNEETKKSEDIVNSEEVNKSEEKANIEETKDLKEKNVSENQKKEDEKNDSKNEVKSEEKKDTNKNAKVKESNDVEKKPENKTKPDNKKGKNEENIDSNKKKKTIKIVILAIIAIVIIAAVIIYFTVFHKKTIDLSDYIEVTYYTGTYYDEDLSAYDGYATASVELDIDKLKELLGSKKEAERFAEKTTLTVENENNGNLSNGDSVEIKVKISSNYLDDEKLKLKSETVSVLVDGLEEANVLDLFAEGEFEVEISGISPNLSISTNNNSSNEFIKKYVSYSTDEYSGIANGDTVTITAYYNESQALEQGIIIAQDTYEYKVEGQAEYIDSIEELSDTVLETLKTNFSEEINSNIEDQDIYVMTYNFDDVTSSDTYTTSTPELVATYLLTKKGTSSSWNPENRICSIYKVTYTMSTGVSHDWYYVVSTTDVAIKDSQIYEPEELYYNVSGRWDEGETQEEAYNDLIDSYKGSYVIETVQ